VTTIVSPIIAGRWDREPINESNSNWLPAGLEGRPYIAEKGKHKEYYADVLAKIHLFLFHLN